jgi:predicted nucleic acid-binding protein
MIQFDTNVLIALSDTTDAHYQKALQVLSLQARFSASAIAWTEYRSRPLTTSLQQAVRAILRAGIEPFTEEMAALSGNFIHLLKPKRIHRLDTMIAASAIMSGASLATFSQEDFQIFVPHGLKILAI